MNVKIKKLSPTAKIPTRGSAEAAGYDLYVNSPNAPITVPSGMCTMVPTGIATVMPHGTFGAIYPRSGLATKYGLRLANDVGIIDSDYRGEWKIPIFNDGSNTVLEHGERIAQVIFQRHEVVDFEEIETLDNSARGEGGFGSTGEK